MLGFEEFIWFPGSLVLAQYCFDALAQAGSNVAITQGIAQGIATLGPAWASASKQYWAKIGEHYPVLVTEQYVYEEWALGTYRYGWIQNRLRY